MPCVSIITEERSLLSCLFVEQHTLQSQAITGTPWDVPVPRNVTFNVVKLFYVKVRFYLEIRDIVHV